jgi:hypothetical protein
MVMHYHCLIISIALDYKFVDHFLLILIIQKYFVVMIRIIIFFFYILNIKRIIFIIELFGFKH